MINRKHAIALGLAGALALSAATPSLAASVPANTAAVKAAAPGATTDVRWRGGWGGWGWGPAIGVGIGRELRLRGLGRSLIRSRIRVGAWRRWCLRLWVGAL